MKSSFRACTYADIQGENLIHEIVDDPSLIITIPALAEPHLDKTIDSIVENEHCVSQVECIILINEPEGVDSTIAKVNQASYDLLREYSNRQECEWLTLHCLYLTDIPKKRAGVGLARKLAMDEAAKRLVDCGNDQGGLIVALDADCTVSADYCSSLVRAGKERQKVELFNIHFEHELSDDLNFDTIVNYELHLRYFVNWQRILKLPYAFQTIGSSFAVRPNAYLQVGGMNKRKAGEDFYFIHKFTKKGTIDNLHSCTVYPSSRRSERVPFGTGRAIGQSIDNNSAILTYHMQSLIDLESLIVSISDLWSQKDLQSTLSQYPRLVRDFLIIQDFISTLEKLKKNTKSFETFNKSFFQWFDAFRLMKYLHYARDHGYSDLPITQALRMSGKRFGFGNTGWTNAQWLEAFRCHDSSAVNTSIS